MNRKRLAYLACALCLALCGFAEASGLPEGATFHITVTFSVESVQTIAIETEAMPEIVYHWDSSRKGFTVPAYAGGGIWVRNLSSPDCTPCFSARFDPGDVTAFREATGLTAALSDPASGAPLESGESRFLSIEYEGEGAIYRNPDTFDHPYAEALRVQFTFWMP